MRRFLKRVLIAMVLFSTLIVGVCVLLHGKSKRVNIYETNCVFVWGDSQMYQGLDISLLRNKLEKQVLSSANHGLGIYDFLVYEKNIPNNATCVMAFPECALLRNQMSDYNRTGFEIGCLKEVFLSGCPINECIRIFNLNKKSFRYKAFSNSPHIMFPFADSLVYPEPLAGFCGMFTEKKDYYEWKAKAYMKGIQNLYNKRSQLVLVQFPFEKQVEDCARNSINRHLTDSLKFELIKKYAMKYDTIVLHSDSLLMHDLSHLNEVGARLATNRIAEVMKADTINNHFIVITHY